MYRVAISFGNDLGYVEFNEASHALSVVLPNEEKRQATEAFLAQQHTLKLPPESLTEFVEVTLLASESKENFQRILGYLWQATGVHVDWSRPVE